jgi:hypothetical protein
MFFYFTSFFVLFVYRFTADARRPHVDPSETHPDLPTWTLAKAHMVYDHEDLTLVRVA